MIVAIVCIACVAIMSMVIDGEIGATFAQAITGGIGILIGYYVRDRRQGVSE